MKKNIILLIVALAMFMEAVDTTILNTAIPAMAKSLNTDPINLKLALISYLLSLTIFIPISGWIADKFGVKKTFLYGMSLFTISSIACGLTHNLIELIIARSFQGLGGALNLPIGRLIIARIYERHELINKMSAVVIIAAIGMMLGPLLGGVITEQLSWRWIFWVNIPIGMVSIALTYYFLPIMPPRSTPPLDKLGFILFGSGLSALTFGLSTMSESHLSLVYSLSTIGIAVLLLLFYTAHSYNREHPIVRIALLHIRTFRISTAGNLFARFTFGGLPFLLPLLLQIGLGFSPQLSGLLVAPTALGVLLVKPFSFPILRFFGYRNVLVFNTCLIALSLCSFAIITAATSVYVIAFLTLSHGFLISLQFSAMNSLAYANIDQDDISSATSILSTIQQLSQSLGIAIGALLLRYFAGFDDKVLTPPLFHRTFLALGLFALCSATIFVFLEKEDGHELIDIPNQS